MIFRESTGIRPSSIDHFYTTHEGGCLGFKMGSVVEARQLVGKENTHFLRKLYRPFAISA